MSIFIEYGSFKLINIYFLMRSVDQPEKLKYLKLNRLLWSSLVIIIYILTT